MKQHIRTRSTQLALVALLGAVAACGNRDDITAPTGNGTIALTLTAPDGTAPSVTITGPNGYSHTVSGTSTLTHLNAGSYTISADSIVTQSTIVGYSVDTAAITGNPITVTSSGASAATVTYALSRQHGALWVTSNSNSFLSGFARSQLLMTAIVEAADTIGNLAYPLGVAFDINGNLWVGTNETDTLKMFTIAQRNSGSGIAAPSRVLVSSSLSSPEAIAFDSHGNLWVADNDNGLLEFSAAQLTAGGTAGPAAITLTDTLPNYESLYAVAFDAAGNAWVGEDESDNVIEYSVAQLASSGSPTPTVRLGIPPSLNPRVVADRKRRNRAVRGARANAIANFNVVRNLNSPDALAFDSHDNLWVANYDGHNVSAYSSAQRASSGDPTPSIVITIPGSNPYGVTFDKNGGLWLSDNNDYSVRQYSAAQIAASGTPAPTVMLTSGIGDSILNPQQIAFDEWVVPSTPPLVGHRITGSY